MKFLNVYFNGRQQIYHHDKDIKATHNLFLYREISKLKLFLNIYKGSATLLISQNKLYVIT